MIEILMLLMVLVAFLGGRNHAAYHRAIWYLVLLLALMVVHVGYVLSQR